MCIMTVSKDQPTDEMLEGMAHNTGTVVGDFALLYPTLKGRNDVRYDALLAHAEEHMRAAYATLLECFTMSVADQSSDAAGHVHHKPGNERTIEQMVNSATRHAHEFETR